MLGRRAWRYSVGFPDFLDTRAFRFLWTFLCLPSKVGAVPDFAGLGAAIRKRRKALGLSQRGLQLLAEELGEGVTDRTIGDVERGHGGNQQLATRRALMQALGWTLESWDALLDGREPTLVKAATPASETPPVTNVGPDPEDDTVHLIPNDQDLRQMALSDLFDIRDRVTAEIDRRARQTELA